MKIPIKVSQLISGQAGMRISFISKACSYHCEGWFDVRTGPGRGGKQHFRANLWGGVEMRWTCVSAGSVAWLALPTVDGPRPALWSLEEKKKAEWGRLSSPCMKAFGLDVGLPPSHSNPGWNLCPRLDHRRPRGFSLSLCRSSCFCFPGKRWLIHHYSIWKCKFNISTILWGAICLNDSEVHPRSINGRVRKNGDLY